MNGSKTWRGMRASRAGKLGDKRPSYHLVNGCVWDSLHCRPRVGRCPHANMTRVSTVHGQRRARHMTNRGPLLRYLPTYIRPWLGTHCTYVTQVRQWRGRGHLGYLRGVSPPRCLVDKPTINWSGSAAIFRRQGTSLAAHGGRAKIFKHSQRPLAGGREIARTFCGTSRQVGMWWEPLDGGGVEVMGEGRVRGAMGRSVAGSLGRWVPTESDSSATAGGARRVHLRV